jgi:hypothetical protein
MFIFLFNLKVDVAFENLHTTIITYYNLAQDSFGTHLIWIFHVDSYNHFFVLFLQVTNQKEKTKEVFQCILGMEENTMGLTLYFKNHLD